MSNSSYSIYRVQCKTIRSSQTRKSFSLDSQSRKELIATPITSEFWLHCCDEAQNMAPGVAVACPHNDSLFPNASWCVGWRVAWGASCRACARKCALLLAPCVSTFATLMVRWLWALAPTTKPKGPHRCCRGGPPRGRKCHGGCCALFTSHPLHKPHTPPHQATPHYTSPHCTSPHRISPHRHRTAPHRISPRRYRHRSGSFAFAVFAVRARWRARYKYHWCACVSWCLVRMCELSDARCLCVVDDLWLRAHAPATRPSGPLCGCCRRGEAPPWYTQVPRWVLICGTMSCICDMIFVKIHGGDT